jgi:NAD(P)-dependent dehydrogenase (short-subunit alcohol dehydrogenase family)
MRLDGKSAVIIGGTGDIGHATARLFVAAGATVVITGRTRERVAAKVAALASNARGVAVDPSDESQLRHLFVDHGGFDYALLTLGTQAVTMPFEHLPEEQLLQGMNEKFLYYTRALRAGLGQVRESVTWLTGAAARTALPGLSGYAAPNGALHSMARPLAMELAPVRINCVSSGLARTNFWSHLGMAAEEQAVMYSGAKDTIPVGYLAGPEDLAHAMLFAATNRYMTGAVLDLDGGLHLGRMLAKNMSYGSVEG